MPINALPQYYKAEEQYHNANTTSEKLAALKQMMLLVPKHKGSEKVQKEIKEKVAKLKERANKEKLQKKKSGHTYTIKKEGAAQIGILGATNTGKSTLLAKLTNAKPLIT